VVNDSLAFYQNDWALIYANGTVTWGVDLYLSKVVTAAESINSLYLSITGRRGDSGGMNYWYSDYMNACESNANCDPSTAATVVNQEALNQVANAIQFSYDSGEGTWGGLVGEFTYCEAKAMGY